MPYVELMMVEIMNKLINIELNKIDEENKNYSKVKSFFF